MTVDTIRFFPFVKEFLTRHDVGAAERVRAIEAHIGALRRSFEQLVIAEGQFRNDCRASHLNVLKEAASSLRQDAEALNRAI